MLRRLFLKILLILSPVWVVLVLYVWKDPFAVIHHYDTYYGAKDSTVVVAKNFDYIATETLIQNYPKYHYDSYIFGGSRSGYFSVAQWAQYLPTGASTYHFNANTETLFGVERKVAYLQRHNMPIRDALIIVDYLLLKATTNTTDYITIKHPATSGGSWLAFHKPFVQAFFDRKFLYAWCDYQLNGKIKRYMHQDGTLHRSYVWYNNQHNELILKSIADSLAIDPVRFYQLRDRYFHPRPAIEQVAPASIGAEQLVLLQHIATVFRQNNTRCKIIVSPLYDQLKLAPHDLAILQQLFGSNNVLDFSGKNDITESKYNYYENAHYSPATAARLLDSVYKKR